MSKEMEATLIFLEKNTLMQRINQILRSENSLNYLNGTLRALGFACAAD